MSTNPLWDRIQKYMDDPSHRYSPKPADLARDSGVSEQVLSKWKAKPTLPRPMHLLAFAAGTGIPYEELLVAVLQGQMYLLPQDASAKLTLSRRWRNVYRGYGDTFAEQLKEEPSGAKPVDLSDIFGRVEIDAGAVEAVNEVLARTAGERPVNEQADTTTEGPADIRDAN